jgi:hypothetical protein
MTTQIRPDELIRILRAEFGYTGGGAGVFGGGASPQVAYWTAANVIAGDAGFTYDAGTNTLNVAGRMGVGAAATATDGTITLPDGGWIGSSAQYEYIQFNYTNSYIQINAGVAAVTSIIRLDSVIPYGNLIIGDPAATIGAGSYGNSILGGWGSAIGTSCQASSIIGASNSIGNSATYSNIIGRLCTIGTSANYGFAGGLASSISNNVNYSFAWGRSASAAHSGVIIFSDSTNAAFASTAANQFAARCNGGAWFNATDLAATPGIFDVLTLEGRITGAGVGAANDGVGILFKFESATNGQYRDVAKIGAAWSDATDATRTSYMPFYLVNSASALTEYMRLAPNSLTVYAPTALTNAINYNLDLQHSTSGAAAPLFGIGQRHYLEDSAGNMQVASEAVTLWAASTSGAESPLLRFTTYPAGSAGPAYHAFWTYRAVAGAAITVIPNGAGDVTRGLRCVYTIYLNGGAIFSAGTVTATTGGGAVDLYNAGGEQFTITVAADGSVSVAQAAGADNADIGLFITWQ